MHNVRRQDEKELIIKSIQATLADYKWEKAIQYLGNNGYFNAFTFFEQNNEKELRYRDEDSLEQIKAINNHEVIQDMLHTYFNQYLPSKTQRWNKGKITVYPDGTYESAFSWDQQVYLDDMKGGVWSAIYYLSTHFKDYFNEELSTYEDWQQAEVEIWVKDGQVGVSGTLISKGEETPFTKELPPTYWRRLP